MTAAALDDHSPMALPLPNGKLAMWLFLVTEIMFFTALIGVYLILRNGIPNHAVIRWPTPEQVHLNEFIGAFNTFVLILSSLTVVLAHYAAEKGNIKHATLYIAVTALLGIVFLGVKYTEYMAKIDHDILPGRVGELLDFHGEIELTRAALKEAEEHGSKGHRVTELKQYLKELEEMDPGVLARQNLARSTHFHQVGVQYINRVRQQLTHAIEHAKDAEAPEIVACRDLLKRMEGTVNNPPGGKASYTSPLTPGEVGGEVNHILHKYPDKVHLTPAIPNGNMWASCYFAMTGFHALHVFGGVVAFVIILIVSLRGRTGPNYVPMLEYTGLYWHFVDIVWIFLFPLLYLV
jgi:cytochrome c oxidase subunit 3